MSLLEIVELVIRYTVASAMFVGFVFFLAHIGTHFSETITTTSDDLKQEREYRDGSEYPSKAGEDITYIPFDGDVPY